MQDRGNLFSLTFFFFFFFFFDARTFLDFSLFKTSFELLTDKKKGKRKVQGVPQSQTAALPRHQEEEETEKTKQAQIEQTYEKH